MLFKFLSKSNLLSQYSVIDSFDAVASVVSVSLYNSCLAFLYFRVSIEKSSVILTVSVILTASVILTVLVFFPCSF